MLVIMVSSRAIEIGLYSIGFPKSVARPLDIIYKGSVRFGKKDLGTPKIFGPTLKQCGMMQPNYESKIIIPPALKFQCKNTLICIILYKFG